MSEYTGKDVSYYLVTIAKPKRLEPYTAECEDIIEALGMSFAEGCAFKAIWRKCAAATLGLTKAGYKGGLYDAEKTQYYGARMVAAEERLSKTPAVYQDGETIVVHTPEQAAAVRHAFLPQVHTMANPPGEDVWVEFAARSGYKTAVICTECKTISCGDVHAATCSQLTAPEEYKAEAQVAFDEAANLAETIARQVSAGAIDTGFGWDAAVSKEEAILEAEEEPAAAMDDDSPRMQAIGQNGNDGEHYDDPWAGAPDWAKYKAQDKTGLWVWYERPPRPSVGGLNAWIRSDGNAKLGGTGANNPNWRDTLITRT